MARKTIAVIGGGANSAIATYRACHKQPGPPHENDVPQGLSEAQNEIATKQPLHSTAADAEPDLEVIVKMIGAVGNDNYGEKCFSELNKNGVDCSGLITVPNTQSSVCFIMIEDHTRENRCLCALGATASWKKEHFQSVEQLGHGMQPDLCVAQMEISKEVVEQMIETAGRANIDFVLKAAPANPVAKRTYCWITHLLVNESEAAVMSGRNLDEVNKDSWDTICQEFLDRGVKNVVITLGDEGAYYANKTDRGRCPAYKVKVVETTGAGDTFTGVYSFEYLRQKELAPELNWNIKQAVIRANKAATMAITKMGAQGGIPWSDELDRFDALLNDHIL